MLSPKSSVTDLLTLYPQAVPVFLEHNMSCVGCSMSAFETLEDAARIYGVAFDKFLGELNGVVHPSASSTTTAPLDGAVESTLPQTSIKELFMVEPYTFFTDLAGTIETIPTESIVSRTIFRDDHLKAIVFAFAPGQELSEHTASVPAIIQIVEGEAEMILGEDHYQVKAGAWARMPANLKHSIVAQTPVKMLLIMLP